jgi:hypothetical protein
MCNCNVLNVQNLEIKTTNHILHNGQPMLPMDQFFEGEKHAQKILD